MKLTNNPRTLSGESFGTNIKEQSEILSLRLMNQLKPLKTTTTDIDSTNETTSPAFYY